ncbi:MAG: hypothetical protein P8Y64_05095 [Gammaproteobacteria bacterium]
MSRLSPAHVRIGGALQTVDDMPTLVRNSGTPPTWLVDLSPLRRWLVRGGQAADWLAARDLPIPEEFFRVHDLGEDAFLVRTGEAEFILHDGPGGALRTALGKLSDGVADDLVAGTRIVARDDLEVVLGGEDAGRLMSEFCALDLAEVENRFLFTRVAGVTAWLCVEGTGAQRSYRIGCDPSYGEYLFETLLDGVHECGGGLVGFLDFYESRGIKHDAS